MLVLEFALELSGNHFRLAQARSNDLPPLLREAFFERKNLSPGRAFTNWPGVPRGSSHAYCGTKKNLKLGNKKYMKCLVETSFPRDKNLVGCHILLNVAICLLRIQRNNHLLHGGCMERP